MYAPVACLLRPRSHVRREAGAHCSGPTATGTRNGRDHESHVPVRSTAAIDHFNGEDEMAEINIERKERTTWPWLLLGLLLVALLAWWLLSRNDDGDFATVQDTTGAVIDTADATSAGIREGAPGALSDFVAWTNENRARQEADTTHAFTAEGIRHLADAIAEIVDRDTTGAMMLRQRADTIRGLADALQRNWQSTNHAEYARRAFMEATMALESLRDQRYPNAATQVAQVRQAAEGVQANQTLLPQRQQVQQFFDRAAEALQTMGNTRTS